jgi:hypothetical protein
MQALASIARERADRPNRIQRGCDISGWPTDPLHPWNEADEADAEAEDDGFRRGKPPARRVVRRRHRR